MHKKNYLTKEEQIIFTIINKTDIIDNEQIKEIFPNYSSQKINKLCDNLISKGRSYPVKRQIYIVNDISKLLHGKRVKINLDNLSSLSFKIEIRYLFS